MGPIVATTAIMATYVCGYDGVNGYGGQMAMMALMAAMAR